MLAPPPVLGLPSYPTWRKGQPESILRLIDSPKRFAGLVLPTGSGKSLIAMAYMMLHGGRGCYVTSTRSLQDQLGRDYESVGLVDIRGQANYQCAIEPCSVDEAPCHAGVKCDLKRGGCEYYDQLDLARKSQLVCTNYPFYFAQQQYGAGLGAFDVLILDEAHAVPEELGEFLAVRITERESLDYLFCEAPPTDDWWSWARAHYERLEREYEQAKADPADRAGQKRIRQGKRLLTKLARLTQAKDWIREEVKGGVRFDPVWPGQLAEEVLYRKIPKVVFVSATIRPRTLDLAGVAVPVREFLESGSGFPVSRRPVYYLPTARLTYRSTEEDLTFWLYTIDRIIRDRQDRKGIIHTVSYRRAQLIRQRSKFAHLMILHDAGDSAAAVARFKKAKAPAILVSPSVSTGLDFPMAECEYQIISKIPFPDSRSLVLKARATTDKDYFAYLAMQEIVQAVGRGMRSAEDQCESFILDAHWSWFGHKYKHYAPGWFMEAVRKSDTAPAPLPKLQC